MEDFRTQLDAFISELEQNPSHIENLTPDMVKNMTEDDVTKVRKLSHPFGRTIQGANKQMCLSITNLRDEYMKKLHMTALVGYMYRALAEYKTEEYTSEVFVRRVRTGAEEADYSQKDLAIINEFYPNRTGLAGTSDSLFVNGMCVYDETDEQYFGRKQKLQSMLDYENTMKRSNIKEFLDGLFEFNPDMHVRRAKEKLTRESMQTTPADLRYDDYEYVDNIPLDTFARYQNYINMNYEKLIGAVSTLYSVQPDIHIAINPYDTFEDGDGKTSEQKADDFIKKHQKEVIADILAVKSGSWNLIGPFSKNRERVNFLNDNTRVIEDIFKQIEVDSKLGADLMRKKVLVKREQNKEREGPIHPNFLNHKRENMSNVEALGAEAVTENKLQTVEEKDALEVKVISIDAGKGTMNTSYFHTEASYGKQD